MSLVDAREDRLRPGQAAEGPAWRPGHNPWLIALTVTLATFMEVLDTSIANVALPHIAGGLSSSVDEATWVLTSYLVANAIVLPLSGWIAGYIGRKRFYISCVALFTISSVMCGMATSLEMLIWFRVLQGAGGGGLQPSEQSILADTFPPAQFGMAFAVYGMAVVLAPALGPTLGGYLTDNISWRYIFFINLPVGLTSMILSWRVLEDPPYLREQVKRNRRTMRIDYPGIILLSLALGSLQVMLDRGQQDDWFGSRFITGLAVTMVVSAAVFVIHELRERAPVVELGLFRQRNFATTNLMMFVLGFVLYSSTVLLPLYMQELMGYSAELSGMAISPGALLLIGVLPLVGILTTRVDARLLVMGGFVGLSLAMYQIAGIDLQVDFMHIVLYRVYQSIPLAFLFIPINTLAYVGIDRERSREVSSLLNLFRNIGGSVGIAVLETLVIRRADLHQERLVGHPTPYSVRYLQTMNTLSSHLFHHGLSQAGARAQALGRIYTGVLQQAAALAYVDAYYALAVVCLLMAPLALAMRKLDRASGAKMAH